MNGKNKDPAFPKTANDVETYEIPINWFLMPFKMTKDRLEFGTGKRKILLGFCMATERLIQMQLPDVIELLTRKDESYTEVKDGKIQSWEMNQGCLNIDCPVNKSTKESYCFSLGMSKATTAKVDWNVLTSYRNMKWEAINK